MIEYITKKDNEALEEYLLALQNEARKESKKLAGAAGYGGSVPSFMPEYQAIEAKVHSIQDEIGALKKRIHELHATEESDIPDNIITNYTVVSYQKLENEEELEIYIIDPEIIKARGLNIEYRIVTPKSPLAKAFLGKKSGDVVIAELPAGKIEYKILDIKNKFF